MKIYEIGTGYTPIPAQMGAATEIVVEELTRSFIKNGIDATIIDIKAQNRAECELPIMEVSVPKPFTKTDVSLGIMHKLKRVCYSISLAKKLKKILKATDEKVVLHFHNQYNLFFFLKLTSKKLREKATIAYTVHSYIWHGDWGGIEETVKKRYFQEIFCLQNADICFVLNEKTRSNIERYIGITGNKIILVNNGVNTNVYKPLAEDEKASTKNKYGLDGKRVFVQVGSVCERKNQLKSLELLLPLMKEDSNTVFCYAGGIISEEYQNAIVNYATENGVCNQIRYLGEIPPGKMLNDIYNIAEAMIFPSTAEGFSLVVIEALSAGIPVIVQSSLQFKLIDKCVVYDENKNDFCSLVKNVILDENNKKIIINEARKAIFEKYSWDSVAKEQFELFLKLS
jgi:glycosyltransferase involved in cell wall biosynthesis